MTVKEQYNQLPRPTFRWMKVNYLELPQLTPLATKHVDVLERHEGDVQVEFYMDDRICCRNEQFD